MRDLARPLRTLLYVPGNKEDWILKAPKYGSDALILDLEDSVPPSEKSLISCSRKMLLEGSNLSKNESSASGFMETYFFFVK